MKTFEPGKIRPITEMLDGTLHVQALRVQLELALSEVQRLQIENAELRSRSYGLENRIKELCEMLAVRGEALGLGNP